MRWTKQYDLLLLNAIAEKVQNNPSKSLFTSSFIRNVQSAFDVNFGIAMRKNQMVTHYDYVSTLLSTHIHFY
jgi:hypothetical protein